MMKFFVAALGYAIAFSSAPGFVLAAAPVDVPDTMAERMKPCIACHGPEDRMGRDAYYPRIAGKPEGYLFNQLRNFRDEQRYYRPMALLLENLTDQYLIEMAHYFSTLKQPYPPPERMLLSPEEIKQARSLIDQGDPARKIPACRECHGKELMGTRPFIPGLLGSPRVYMIAQLGAWRNGGILRGQTANCMSEIAKQLTAEETNVVAAWLAAQPVPANAGSGAELSPEMSRRCGSIIQRGGVVQ